MALGEKRKWNKDSSVFAKAVSFAWFERSFGHISLKGAHQMGWLLRCAR